jgi:glycogen debranching enzyme
MTIVARRAEDLSIVAGRTFARTAPDGRLDGESERGIYAEDLRLLRRVELFRAERDIVVTGMVALGPEAAVVRFQADAVEPGTGILLVVEFDGTDLFDVRRLLVDSQRDESSAGGGLGLGHARPDARMRVEVVCTEGEPVDCDGVARSDVPIRIDGTPRTASWRWDVAGSAVKPVDLVVELRCAWALNSDMQPPECRSFEELESARHDIVGPWIAGCPTIDGDDALSAVMDASIRDLSSLRIPVADGFVLAGGVPWYLTVFGRDSLLAAWMALPIDPDLADSTLRHLARHQSTSYDLAIDAEPGKIQHEERRGVAAERWHERYFGSVDSTPLFLMLLAEHNRWTGDEIVARELEDSARAAVAWLLSRTEEDELGLLSFWRRADRGLDVQSWKDSSDSQRDSTGRTTTGLIRPIEAQGYAVAALRGAARLATSVWNDEVAASEWNAAARVIERRLVDRGFVELPSVRLAGDDDPRSGGFMAQAIDSEGHAVDALCSNPGHLLWSDAIADPSLRTRVVEQLTSDALDSGWGIRTMSTLDASYDPSSYHCGSVWPHDTALCIAGIARSDRGAALRLGRQLLDAAVVGSGRLPEHFSGEPRGASTKPIELEAACSPHAWASAAPLLVLRTMLGLEPDADGNELVATSVALPEWLRGLRWHGVRALGARWDVEVGRDGLVDVVRNAD